MLVLSRKKQDSIILYDGPEQVSIRVLEVRGGTVKIGIEAPASVSVRRGELSARLMRREKILKIASSMGGGDGMAPVPSVVSDRRFAASSDA